MGRRGTLAAQTGCTRQPSGEGWGQKTADDKAVRRQHSEETKVRETKEMLSEQGRGTGKGPEHRAMGVQSPVGMKAVTGHT